MRSCEIILILKKLYVYNVNNKLYFGSWIELLTVYDIAKVSVNVECHVMRCLYGQIRYVDIYIYYVDTGII